ncbi:DUF669 domain-containing protein [Pseudoxanthomonas sacheonensis]|uniref:DUF669 domain-containing protein n=1 Tax=Pseudoxanthomonas sacheonensis TaxID=443615 RepID=UPI0013D5CE37|nr:DUF669 domain-containing protein [Pseudoxanthomonas sacheonensis]
MANLTGMYNPEAEAQQDFAPIPAGEYLARIVESDMKPTKNNDGQYLELVYEIMDGEYAKRRLWARLNLENKNDQTVEIANRQMASIREATGVAQPRDSQELHNKPHVVRVDFIPAGTTQKNGYVTQKDQNEIRGWKKGDGIPFETNTTQQVSQSTSSAGASPWKKQAA